MKLKANIKVTPSIPLNPRGKFSSLYVLKGEFTYIFVAELDETAYWLELLFDATIDRTMNMTSLMTETDELISIFTSIVKKVKNG